MVIDLLGKEILKEIQKVPGFEKAVIAGGFCRDHILGGDWKDIDVFFPCKDISTFKHKIKNIIAANLPRFSFVETKLGYNETGGWKAENLLGLAEFYYLDAIEIQIMGYKLHEEDFGKNVSAEFSYGIDQAWTEDCKEIKTSVRFDSDKQNKTATLLSKCDISVLPRHIEKFLRLNKKYKNKFTFRCPDLMFKDYKPETKVKTAEQIWGGMSKSYVKKWIFNDLPPLNVDAEWADAMAAVDQAIPQQEFQGQELQGMMIDEADDVDLEAFAAHEPIQADAPDNPEF